MRQTNDDRFTLLQHGVAALTAGVREALVAAQVLEDNPMKLPDVNGDLMKLVVGYLEHAHGTGAIEVIWCAASAEMLTNRPHTLYNRVGHALAPSDSDVCICDGCITSCVSLCRRIRYLCEDQVREAQSLVDDAKAQLDDAMARLASLSQPPPILTGEVPRLSPSDPGLVVESEQEKE